jgi:hypothetical protein
LGAASSFGRRRAGRQARHRPLGAEERGYDDGDGDGGALVMAAWRHISAA